MFGSGSPDGQVPHVMMAQLTANALCLVHLKSLDCAGHMAYIRLVLPVFHVGYFKQTITILQDICKVRPPLLAAGDSKSDLPMLEMADIKIVIKGRALESTAREREWFVL